MGDFIIGVLVHIFIAVILLPVCLVVFTPIVLVGAFFGKGSYGANVRAGYAGVFEFWGTLTSSL